MDYNYHTHTFLCNHASETPEEYVQRAIEGGIKHMGFSDHASFIFPDGYESRFRVPVEKTEFYVNEISRLSEKYKNEIDIKIGFEMEYYPEHFDKMLTIARENGIEYLILGQHFLFNEHPEGVVSCKQHEDIEELREYIRCVSSGILSGVFTYVAHPDMFAYDCDIDTYCKEIRQICVLSRERNVPLEINFLGIRTGRHYPNERFWAIAGEENSPVTFGLDAHAAIDAFDGESEKTALKLVEKYNLNYIGKPELVSII